MNHINHLLIFEPEVAGHQPLYIRLLYDYLRENKPALKVSFVVNSNLSQRLEREDGIKLQPVEDNIDILFLSEMEISASMHKKLWIRAINQWNIMKKYLKITGADHGHFLHFDLIQLPLALRLPFVRGKKISGLLFAPSIHDLYQNNSSSLKEKIRDYRKKLFYALMLNNDALSFIYTLDAYFPYYARQNFSNGHKVYHLPDPSMFPTDNIHLNDEECALARRVVRDNKKMFLLFGYLERRKGIFEIVEALWHLEPKYASQIIVVFAGRLHNNICLEFMKKIEYYKRDNLEGAIIYIEDRRLSTNEIICLLQHCNVVLAPYQRFVGSSGVLLWAAGAKKPVITQDYGFLGYQTRTYNLGIAVDTTKPKKIADAFRSYLDNPSFYKNINDMEKFHTENLPENYVKTFFNNFL